jgi:hypothetical protein
VAYFFANKQTDAMTAIIQFDPQKLSPEILQLLIAKATEWNCSPAEAMERLLDQLAKRHAKQAA